MRSMTTKLLLNSSSGALLFLANVVIVFIMSPIILRELGDRNYGTWEMILSFCGYLGILELGVAPAIIRYVAREQVIGNREALDRILSSAFWGLLLVGVLALAVLAGAAYKPEAVLSVPAGEIEGLSLLFVLVGCNLCVQFVGTLFTAYLMGSQEHFKVNGLSLILAPAQSILLYLVLTRADSFELTRLAGVILLGSVVKYGILAAIVLRRPEVALRRTSFSWPTVRELYRFGASSMLLTVDRRLRGASLPLVIGYTLGAPSVVFYAIPKRLVEYAWNFALVMATPLMPYFSSIDARRVAGERMAQWIPLSRAVSFLTLPGALALLALGKPFIATWLGTSYADGGQWVIVSLALSFLLTGPFANSNQVLVAMAKHGPPARKVLIVSVAAVAVAIPVTRQFGVTGGAVVLALASLAGTWVFWRAASREIGIGLAEHLQTTVRPLLIPAVLMAASLTAGRLLAPSPGYSDLAGIAAGSALLYIAAVWQMAVTSAERRRILAKLASLIRGL